MSGFVGYGRDQVTEADEMVSVEEHLAGILALLPRPEPIQLVLGDALGLVLAEDVVSTEDVPTFASSAMDGYAVVSSDLAGASPDRPIVLPVVGEIAAGAHEIPTLGSGRTVRIMTGAPVPPGADAIVPVEITTTAGDAVGFRHRVEPGEHIRAAGEAVAEGQQLAAAGRRITPGDVALLAASGVTRVVCVPPPRVVILTTGDELVRADEKPGPSQLRDSNSPMLAALVRAAGGVPFTAGIVPDDHKAIADAFDANAGHADLFVCTGGASAGTRDFLPEVIGELGEVANVKVAMRPGMPQIRGRIGDIPVIGLPGNPVSSFVSFEVFVRPALRQLQGRRDVARPAVRAVVTEALTAPPHKRGYARVRLKRDGARWLATPTGSQGSHVITSLSLADGLAIVPEDVPEIRAGDEVVVHLLID